MNAAAQRWEQIYGQVPLCDIPRHFAGIGNSPFLLEYLKQVLRLAPSGSRTLETGIGSGYGAIWLSRRGLQTEGFDYSPVIVERARQVNNILGGSARFRIGDLFDFYEKNLPRYRVIHHQGVVEHFNVPQIRAALAQQVAAADYVVFSVPSVNYPFEPEFGDERLLPIEEWERILSPFDVVELRYYGDPRLGGREQIMATLRGQKADAALIGLMHLAPEPYPNGISAIVHTRQEAKNIADCLGTLKDWADEIIVCDMESEDGTVDIARTFTDNIILHPHIQNFDRARNVSAMRAQYRWIFFLDADERVPLGLGQALRHIVYESTPDFEAMYIPFQHYFAGHWMQCLYPGYTAPRLLKNGKFLFNARLHSGAQVDGRCVQFPADRPELALTHYSFDSLAHYLDKLNRYTDGEAENMHRDGQPFVWQNAVRHFVDDFKGYYDKGHATKDGVHGFIYSFNSAFYRFFQHAKLYERRFKGGQLVDFEKAIPASVEEILEFALQVAREKPRPQAVPISIIAASENPELDRQCLWSGPIYDPAGYGDESRHMLLALAATGIKVAAQSIPWGTDVAAMPEADKERLDELCSEPVSPGFAQIIHNFAPGFYRHPNAGVAIGRTVFETDRLPQEWVRACNRMDYVWVPTKFNKKTFAQAGVLPEKLVVVPECLDVAAYDAERGSPIPNDAAKCVRDIAALSGYKFLTMFDWTLHKGWDALLNAFLAEFQDKSDIHLVLKVWSSMGYSDEDMQRQASDHVRKMLGIEIDGDARVHWIFERISDRDLRALYRAADCYVLPSRGEGWGRPYMEAMATGLPVIATNWSGNTEFMSADNSYLVDCDLVDVPEAGWREVGTYKGHRWAEPKLDHVRAQMRKVFSEQKKAKEVGKKAASHIKANFSREAVGPKIAAALTAAQDGRTPKPNPLPQNGGKRSGSEPVRVRWEGTFWQWHSLAHVNRTVCLGLAGNTDFELGLVNTDPPYFDPRGEIGMEAIAELGFASLSGSADVHIRHGFPPRLDPPCEGRLVLMQPWEYGYLPETWVDPIRNNVAEVWCNSRYVWDVYANSGISEDRLQLVPLGVDTSVFNPGAPPYVFTDEPGAALWSSAKKASSASRGDRGAFVFVYVGGSIHRKGADILIDAYIRAFSAADDIVLLVKDTGNKTVYRDQNESERIKELAADPTRPRIVYLDDDLSAHQLAGIYTAADCAIHPYRGEGFCLPVLEAMACGVPAIVPEGGPTDDFLDESVGWRIQAERRPFGDGSIGHFKCVGTTWMFEVAVNDLARLMREVSRDKTAAKIKGKAAAERVAAGWTWEHTGAIVRERLKALKRSDAAYPLEPGSPPNPQFWGHRNGTEVVRTVPPSPSAQNLGSMGSGPEASPEEIPLFTVSDRRGRKAAGKIGPVSISGPTISLCMIVKNEERVLGDCLASIKPWVNEIIVVDTGSNDRTVQIAEEHGAKVYQFPWTDSFSEARNVSVSHATKDWILWMDADDTIPEHCGRMLHDTVLVAEANTAGIIMQVHIPPAPGENGFTIVDHVKLFRNLPELRFEGRIHEQILEPIYRIGGVVERSSLYVVHSGYDYSPEGQKSKRARDLLLLEKDLADRPDHPFVLFNIGMTAFHMRDFSKAKSALERCLSVSKPNESTIRKVFAMLSGCELEMGNLGGAKERIEQGLSLHPRDPELLFRAGGVYHQLGNLAAAEQSYLRLLNDHEVGHIDSIDVSITTHKAHHNLGVVYRDMGLGDRSEEHFRQAIQLQ